MHPSLTETFACLDRSRAGLRAAVDSVPAHARHHHVGEQQVQGARVGPAHAQRLRAARGLEHGVAGVLEHLSIVDERFTAIVANKIAEARAAGLGNEEGQPPPLPPHVEAMLADRTERRNAPDLLHPRGLESAAAWERAEAARAAFRLMLIAADGLALSGVIHEHPRFGALNAYQWGGFLAAHESRHAEQIREIASQLASR